MTHSTMPTQKFPLTSPGPAYAAAVRACASPEDLTPAVYKLTVEVDGGVTLSWDGGPKPHGRVSDRIREAVIIEANTATGASLRGLVTAVRHGLIR